MVIDTSVVSILFTSAKRPDNQVNFYQNIIAICSLQPLVSLLKR